VIAIVALVVLGPDKLPQAMVKMVKMFKMFSKSINEAKSAIEEELNLQELKEDSKKYRALLENNTQQIKKTLTFDELSALSESAEEVNSAIEELKLTGERKSEITPPKEPSKTPELPENTKSKKAK